VNVCNKTCWLFSLFFKETLEIFAHIVYNKNGKKFAREEML